ncbi:MAG: hypothetical protein IPM86_16485 [Saprospiraceae bacterium]|nr:hypothetical protein [Saprospiraceae bacterium]
MPDILSHRGKSCVLLANLYDQLEIAATNAKVEIPIQLRVLIKTRIDIQSMSHLPKLEN